jgi:hypothetical protein
VQNSASLKNYKILPFFFTHKDLEF